MKTFYWYDYETFGLKPQFQRIAQFAGIRTDEDLNIQDKHMLYCKPTHDCLPAPEACAITGITPQDCEEKGLIEHEFIKKINQEFTKPETCIVGYNSIAFDDEFTRHTLFRNFLDPYAWHSKNENTRWDILNLVRFCYAHSKDRSLKWVYDDDNKPSFKLDRLAPANGIEHSDAHDAMADVIATIGIAKIIKDTQPQLFQYALSLRDKTVVSEKIELFSPMLYTSGLYPAISSCTRLTTPLAYHPEYPKHRVVVFNLEQDPKIIVESDEEELRKLRFAKGNKRLQTYVLAFNKSPMFTCEERRIDSPKLNKQMQIDIVKCKQHLAYIEDNKESIEKKIESIYKKDSDREPSIDVDQSLYDNFVSNKDREICDEIQHLSLEQMSSFKPDFEDKKLSKLFLNFKARNYPETLTEDENKKWNEIVESRLKGLNGYLSIESFKNSLIKLIDESLELSEEEQKKTNILCQELQDYAELL
jgi:exodeoxyribonuclease-1